MVEALFVAINDGRAVVPCRTSHDEMKSKNRRCVWIAFGAIGVIAVWFVLPFVMVFLLNADLYGRLTETMTVGALRTVGDTAAIPIIRLTLHRILAGENAVEASLAVTLPHSDLEKAVRRGELSLTAILRDRTTVDPVGLRNVLKIDGSAAEIGFTDISARSARFPIPFIPSSIGFPFDDVRLMPMINLQRPDRYDSPYTLEIQKALPGRFLEVSRDVLNPEIRLTRTSTEKWFVVVGGAVFLALSIILVVALVKSTVLRRFEELLAVAGYFVAAARFRDVLGISREAGASAFEVIVFGVPVVLLAVGIGVSIFRGLRNRPEAPLP